MTDFKLGQRWISDTTPELGLGTVIEVEDRTVTILFLAVAEKRTFTKASPPLSRVRFSIGDVVASRDEWQLKIESLHEENDLLNYSGIRLDTKQATVLPESDLNYFIQFNSPKDKLLNNQFDKNKWFALRYATHQYADKYEAADVNGLRGARINLVPHQLYIAQEVASRFAPRVLLADEVGLGKTIEACLILNKQILTGLTQRALIIVPDALLYQWLVELRRRFNLKFSIFDEDRCLSLLESEPDSNPFHSEQLVLCSLKFFSDYPDRCQQAIDGQWDMLIVDEAHHLQWSTDKISPEYTFIESLAKTTKGLLLLTATPEQLGKVGHFARLRLLDAQRFHSYDEFLAEEKNYEPVAKAVDTLLTGQALASVDQKQLTKILSKASIKSLNLDTIHQDTKAQQLLIRQLIDQHGTGRVLFRNARSNMRGFPKRSCHAYPLANPPAYKSSNTDVQSLLTPELLHPETWTEFDPRVDWLLEFLLANKQRKVLLICAHATTAMMLEAALRTRKGIPAAVFHEGMSIVNRDRAAAYFADEEQAAQILICSEIGSEGRNFQFVNHLVLFDLPLNPDLLEQRIGRLDRIGQKHDIEIHVPYLEDGLQQRLFSWYQQGFNALEETSPAGSALLQRFGQRLLDIKLDSEAEFNKLLKETQQANQEIIEQMQRGRDRLLEFSSFNQDIAVQLEGGIRAYDKDYKLRDFMEIVFDNYGVISEFHSDDCYVLQHGDHMQTSYFPELPEDGLTITYNRELALAHEDRQFLTWDHPMARGCIDMILTDVQGTTAVTVIKTDKLNPGTLMVEALYKLECSAPAHLMINRFTTGNLQRVLLDQKGRNLAKHLSYEDLQELHADIDKNTAKQIIALRKDVINQLLKAAQVFVDKQLGAMVKTSITRVKSMLEPEIQRLETLKQVNANIRQEEIDFLIQQNADLQKIIQASRYRLDALRVIITS